MTIAQLEEITKGDDWQKRPSYLNLSEPEKNTVITYDTLKMIRNGLSSRPDRVEYFTEKVFARMEKFKKKGTKFAPIET